MKRIILSFTINLFMFITSLSCPGQTRVFAGTDREQPVQIPESHPQTNNNFLDQSLPGRTPEAFAKGIVSGMGRPLHSYMAVSPDSNEIFWSVTMPPEIRYVKKVNGIWSDVQQATFTKGMEAFCPSFSPDGNKLFFSSQIIENKDNPQTRKFLIWLWYVVRENGSWSQPQKIDSVINTGDADYLVGVSRNGNLYFSSSHFPDNRGESDIYCSKFTGGKYASPVNLGDSINSAMNEGRVFIAPDESCILFTRSERVTRPQGICQDFYISFRKTDGSWTKAWEIGDLLGEKCSSGFIGLTPDGKYITFTSIFQGRLTNLYWRDSNLIGFLKKQLLKE